MAARETRLTLWQGQIETEVEIRGNGPPLVYLHGPWGVSVDGPFLDRLSQSHTVYAPKHPGTSTGQSEAIHTIDNWWDLVLYYGEVLERLELTAPPLVGHSFGGMVAAELAAALPVQKLVLIDPVGLWREDLPVKNWMVMPEDERRSALFADPNGDAAQCFFGFPSEPKARVAAQVDFVWAQACTGKFVWPIPDKGLKKHTHRIAAPTLILWGKSDGIIAPAYAEEFARRIKNSKIELIDGAGHLPHLEAPDIVANLVRGFLTA
jgi:pimeloyl-ACP methyl ester carboxylesterase